MAGIVTKIYRRVFRYKLLKEQMDIYVKELMLINQAVAEYLGIGINVDMKAGTAKAIKLNPQATKDEDNHADQ